MGRRKKHEPAKEINIHENAELKWRNELISGRFDITSVEFKMLAVLASHIDKNSDDFEYCRVSVSELGKAMGLAESNLYNVIKATANRLMKRSLSFEWYRTSRSKRKSWLYANWFSYVCYDDEFATLEWRFNDLINPLLLKVREAYVRFEAKPLMAFKCVYSNRFLLLFMQWEKLKVKEISIEELKEHFGIKDKYKLFADFRIKVIEPALSEINALSDFNVTAKPIKMGRSYTHYVFTIKRKKAVSKKSIDVVGYPVEWVEEQQKLFDQILAYGVDQNFVKGYISKRCLDDVRANLKYALDHKNTKISNFAGYLRKALEEDYGLNDLLAQAAMERIKEESLTPEQKNMRQQIAEIEAASLKNDAEILSKDEVGRLAKEFRAKLLQQKNQKE